MVIGKMNSLNYTFDGEEETGSLQNIIPQNHGDASLLF